MHLVKVRKKVFKREFLDFKLVIVVCDICQMSREEENTVIEVNKAFWVFPVMKGMEFDESALDNLMK